MFDRSFARTRVGDRRRAALALLAAAVALLAAAPAPAALAAASEDPGATFGVSVNQGGEYADGEGAVAYTPVSISADGRYVAFESAATNLGAVGPAGSAEGFRKDLETGAVALVSRADGAAGAPAGAPGIEDLHLSADGRYVVFTSAATNLGPALPGEAAGERHVYRRDLETGTTALVDRVSGAAGASFARAARAEAVSADGRYVLFAANVANLEDPAGDHSETAFPVQYLRDTVAATTTAVSRADGAGGELANEANEASSVSADGRYVAFATAASNLPGATGQAQVYLRDLQSGTTTLVSASPSGQPGDRASFFPAVVGEPGCEVEYSSLAFNLVEPAPSGEQVYLYDFCASPPTTTLVSERGGELAGLAWGAWGTSGDGEAVLFGASFDLSGAFHLFLADRAGGGVSQVDRASGAGASADGEPQQAAIAANGCRVAFGSQSSNLVAPSPPLALGGEPSSQVYVRQLAPCASGDEGSPGGDPPPGETPAQPPAPPLDPATPPQPASRSAATTGGTGGPPASAPARSLRIAALGRARLLVTLAGPGEVAVRLRRLATHGRRHWPLLRSLAASADGAGPVAIPLGRLGPGRYRLNAWLRGAGAPGTVRFLNVGGGGG